MQSSISLDMILLYWPMYGRTVFSRMVVICFRGTIAFDLTLEPAIFILDVVRINGGFMQWYAVNFLIFGSFAIWFGWSAWRVRKHPEPRSQFSQSHLFEIQTKDHWKNRCHCCYRPDAACCTCSSLSRYIRYSLATTEDNVERPSPLSSMPTVRAEETVNEKSTPAPINQNTDPQLPFTLSSPPPRLNDHNYGSDSVVLSETKSIKVLPALHKSRYPQRSIYI
ncbi:hypothetical protein BDF19DRAFT_424378 [Syncephalis fuscata]|nr:hypothetical protein BDF19DRAFT_424378 [Syncephalis fuscata]